MKWQDPTTCPSNTRILLLVTHKGEPGVVIGGRSNGQGYRYAADGWWFENIRMNAENTEVRGWLALPPLTDW